MSFQGPERTNRDLKDQKDINDLKKLCSTKIAQ